MPVWHKTAQKWMKDGRVALLGIIQEQHPDRCRLFGQWHGIRWPILHDPINVLNATAVPKFIAIDEHGIVRSTSARVDQFESSFLDRKFADDAPAAKAMLTPPRSEADLQRQSAGLGQAAKSRMRGDRLAIWHRAGRLNDAIAAYRSSIKQDAEDWPSHFRLGVCLLERHESLRREAGDFQAAVAAWETALAGRPNQYIWRRRIQQYGPRLSKPYPFYDWVAKAEEEIRARGETPVKLRVRPSGAEIATPSRQFVIDERNAKPPDPQGRIQRDSQKLVQVSVATVPSLAAPGSTVRAHITFVPNSTLKTHWNNESEPLQMWVDAAEGCQLERHLSTTLPVAQDESDEVRRLDVEVKLPVNAKESVTLSAYALYYVCEDINGVCQYLRQDIPIRISLRP